MLLLDHEPSRASSSGVTTGTLGSLKYPGELKAQSVGAHSTRHLTGVRWKMGESTYRVDGEEDLGAVILPLCFVFPLPTPAPFACLTLTRRAPRDADCFLHSISLPEPDLWSSYCQDVFVQQTQLKLPLPAEGLASILFPLQNLSPGFLCFKPSRVFDAIRCDPILLLSQTLA